ncbi:MAG: ParB/RepB/Spo0J family partition protein [Desulfurivibrionaceae bacterium]
MQTAHIKLKDIDFTDYSFSLLPESLVDKCPAELKESIDRVGILHPPIVREGEQEFIHQIITGRKRLHTALALGFDSFSCLKIPSDLPYLEILDIIWEEALHSRPLSPLEQALFLEKAGQVLTTPEIAGRFLPLIGLSPSTAYIQKKLGLPGLDEPLQIAVHEGRLNEQVGLELGELPFSDRMALFEVIDLLKLSVSNQKKLVHSCRELAARNCTTVLSLLSWPEFSEILNNSHDNIPQKAGLFMKAVQEKRYPRLTEAENDFRRFKAGLSLPENITISHDPSFEKDELTLTISCSDRQEARDIVDKIRN